MLLWCGLRMSLISERHLQETDGRFYRNMYWHNLRLRQKREREAMIRKEEEKNERRLEAPSNLPQVAPPGQTLTNPWTDESASELWVDLTSNRSEIDSNGTLTLRKLILAIEAGGPSIKQRLGVPRPDLTVKSDALSNPNRNYVVKLWNLVSNQGQVGFDAESLRSYLVTPLKDPLTRVLETNAILSKLPFINLRI